jgi:hypothetical protein
VDPATGQASYAKRTMIVPLEPNVNAHPRISTIEWYRTEKGFRHPFDPPACPTQTEVLAMDRRRLGTVEAVYARMEQLAGEGLDVEKLKTADPRVGRGRASRRRGR